jgi:hypothetical protein|tara:strand:- start:250 stop:492 length:243 start_codon:yes stop_codon:yes gene_type:complete
MHTKENAMKIDLYTKVILTGIFACLCLLLLRDIGFESRAEANNAARPVQDCRIVEIKRHPQASWHAIEFRNPGPGLIGPQ